MELAEPSIVRRSLRESVRDRAAQTQFLSIGRALAWSAQSHQQREGGYDRHCESNHEWPERGIKNGHTRAEGPGSGPSIQAGQLSHGTQHTDPLAKMRVAWLSSRQRSCAVTLLKRIAKPRRFLLANLSLLALQPVRSCCCGTEPTACICPSMRLSTAPGAGRSGWSADRNDLSLQM